MKRVAFIGSGEMAHHVAHYVVEDKQFEVVGYYDDFTPVGTIVNNYPILGKLEDIETQYQSGVFDELINAIGYTRFKYRKETFEMFENKIPFATFAHSSCIVDSTAEIGKGVIMFPRCIVGRNVRIENNTFFFTSCTISHNSAIESHTYLSPNVAIAGYVKVGKLCNLGIGTIIRDNLTICNNVITGAGAVVVKDITEPGIYAGVPARKIKDTPQ